VRRGHWSLAKFLPMHVHKRSLCYRKLARRLFTLLIHALGPVQIGTGRIMQAFHFSLKFVSSPLGRRQSGTDRKTDIVVERRADKEDVLSRDSAAYTGSSFLFSHRKPAYERVPAELFPSLSVAGGEPELEVRAAARRSA
jgi:hypothetical protein